MPALAIKRLTLDAPGLAEPQARELVRLVAAGLATANSLPDGATIPAIRLELAAGTAPDLHGLAEQVVRATLRAAGLAALGAS
jgi:hypothetical protein